MKTHSATGTIPAAAHRIAAVPEETRPGPVAPAGSGGSARPVPVCGSPYPASPGQALPGGRSGARGTKEGRIFSVTGDCTSCGTCTAVCPVKNIEMTGKKPVWKRHCRLCFACIRTCPAQAIRIGSR